MPKNTKTPDWLRYLVARHLIPLLALLVVVAVNAIYLQFPLLEELGAPKAAVLGIINGALVYAATLLNPNMGREEPWLATPPE